VIQEILKPDTEMVISFSGGKDSSAMLSYLCELYPDIPKHVVWADTGFEHDGLAKWNDEIAKKFNLIIHRVSNPNKDFFLMVRKRKKFPSPSCRQCTSNHKVGPIETWVRQNVKTKNIIMCSGLRAEESVAREKLQPLKLDTQMTNSKRTVHDFLPIHHWTEGQVKDFLKSSGIPLHDCYNYLSRLSCQVCIFNKKRELKAIKANNPEAFEKICELEGEIGFTFKPNGKLTEYIKSKFDNQMGLFD
jgi:3'-phosphoadenosine 5'-phosphosulfate sulfotransferase (PAPS reductase)/FAD synthetase